MPKTQRFPVLPAGDMFFSTSVEVDYIIYPTGGRFSKTQKER